MTPHLLGAEAATAGPTATDIDALLTAAADVVLVVNGDDVVEAVACGLERTLAEHLAAWRGCALVNLIEPGSRAALRGMLSAARARRHGLWQVLRHGLASREELPVAYIAQAVGDEGRVVLMGRDQRELLRLKARLFDERAEHERRRREQQRDEQRAGSATGGEPVPAMAPALEARLAALLEHLADAVVLTDARGLIAWSNASFLRLVDAAHASGVVGRSLADSLHCEPLDLASVLANLRRQAGTQTVRGRLEGADGRPRDVSVSITFLPGDVHTGFGFILRASADDASLALTADGNLFRSAEQLTDLVGKVPLKGMVRDATDKVEKMCIEAALRLTGNNRALAARVLGMSRQGLYQKLHQHQLADGNDSQDEDTDG